MSDIALPRYIARPSRRWKGRTYLVDTLHLERRVLAWSRRPGRIHRCARALNLWATRQEATR